MIQPLHLKFKMKIKVIHSFKFKSTFHAQEAYS